MRTIYLVTVMLLGSATFVAPAWGQQQSCYTCSCCDVACFEMGTEQGGRVDPPGYLFSYCAPNFCGIHCSPQEEEELAAIDMTELWEDLSSTNVTRIRYALTQHPTRVSLNKERKAVQIIGCDHGIIGHVTLREDLFEAVLEVEPDGS